MSFQKLVSNLSEDTLREVMVQIALKDPVATLMLSDAQPHTSTPSEAAGASLTTPQQQHQQTPAQSPSEPHPPNQPDDEPEQQPWCICGNCPYMPEQRERVCCKRKNCYSRLPDIDIVVLDPQLLRIAMYNRNDLVADANLALDDAVEVIHRSFRYAAYRQFILMRHGKLEEGDRRVIPACCVARIRQTYPDPNRDYKGFMSSRFG